MMKLYCSNKPKDMSNQNEGDKTTTLNILYEYLSLRCRIHFS